MRKIKLTCRKKNGTYEKQLYVDGEPLDCAFDPETESAQQFFEALSPEKLTDTAASQCSEDFVLVFRTDDMQMQEFAALLAEHENL